MVQSSGSAPSWLGDCSSDEEDSQFDDLDDDDDEAGEGQPLELEQEVKCVPTIEIIGAYSYDESTDTHCLQGPQENDGSKP